MNYTIEKITTLIGARRIGAADAKIGWLLTDSRSLCFPEETLFFALKSARNDGHRYIEDLYRRGVRNFVVESHFSSLIPHLKMLIFLSFLLPWLLCNVWLSAIVMSSIVPLWVSRVRMVRRWSRNGFISCCRLR